MSPDLILHPCQRFKCTSWNEIKQVANYFRWSPKKIPAVLWARPRLGLRSFWVCFLRRTGTTTACLISWPTETSAGFSVWPGKENQVISAHPLKMDHNTSRLNDAHNKCPVEEYYYTQCWPLVCDLNPQLSLTQHEIEVKLSDNITQTLDTLLKDCSVNGGGLVFGKYF